VEEKRMRKGRVFNEKQGERCQWLTCFLVSYRLAAKEKNKMDCKRPAEQVAESEVKEETLPCGGDKEQAGGKRGAMEGAESPTKVAKQQGGGDKEGASYTRLRFTAMVYHGSGNHPVEKKVDLSVPSEWLEGVDSSVVNVGVSVDGTGSLKSARDDLTGGVEKSKISAAEKALVKKLLTPSGAVDSFVGDEEAAIANVALMLAEEAVWKKPTPRTEWDDGLVTKIREIRDDFRAEDQCRQLKAELKKLAVKEAGRMLKEQPEEFVRRLYEENAEVLLSPTYMFPEGAKKPEPNSVVQFYVNLFLVIVQ
jgi:hypothetical protein